MPTQIDPAKLGAEHIHDIIEVGWQVSSPRTAFRSSLRGVLLRVEHGPSDTTIDTTIDISVGPATVRTTLDAGCDVAVGA